MLSGRRIGEGLGAGLLVLALALGGCDTGGGDDGERSGGDDADAADADAQDADTLEAEQAPEPRFPACPAGATEQVISFVHVNDIHASFTPDPLFDNESPAARQRGFFEQVRAENPYTLFTNGGDDHEKGSVAELLSEGQATIDVVRAMRFDARVIGNHDFAWSPEEFLRFSRDPQAIVLASNTTYDGDDPEGFGAVDWAETQVGCVRIGWFGLVSKPWDERNQQYDGDFYRDGDFHSRFDWAERTRELLQAHAADVDLVVMVSHLGKGADEALAAEVPEIDVILGGHSHTAMSSPSQVGETLIIQAGSNTTFVARLDITVDLQTMAISAHEYDLELNAYGLAPVDEETQLAIEATMLAYAPEALEPITWTRASCSHARIGEITATAALALIEGADAALVSHDTMWATWGAQGLSQQSLLNTYKVERQPAGTPGFNAFYTVPISGADLQRVATEMDSEWTYAGPETIDPAASYSLAIQKKPAYNVHLLPDGVTLGDPTFAYEAFALLEAYGRQRTAACRYLDRDEPLPDCR